MAMLTLSTYSDQNRTKEEAIHLAESFISQNGYTKEEPDRSKIKLELFDNYEENIDSVLKRRFNSLHPDAYCISEDSNSWHVGFLFSGVDLNKLDSANYFRNIRGRAVIVPKVGDAIRIAHKEPILAVFKRIK